MRSVAGGGQEYVWPSASLVSTVRRCISSIFHTDSLAICSTTDEMRAIYWTLAGLLAVVAQARVETDALDQARALLKR